MISDQKHQRAFGYGFTLVNVNFTFSQRGKSHLFTWYLCIRFCVQIYVNSWNKMLVVFILFGAYLFLSGKKTWNNFSALVISERSVMHSDAGPCRYGVRRHVSHLVHVAGLAPPCSVESAWQGGRFHISGECVSGCCVFFWGVVCICCVYV